MNAFRMRSYAFEGILACILCFFSSMVHARSSDVGFSQELSPQILLYTGDVSRASTGAAVQYSYHIGPVLWVGVDVLWNPMRLDQGQSLAGKTSPHLFSAAPVVYWNLPSFLGVEDGTHADFYTSFGLGYLRLGGDSSVYGSIGGGLLIFPWRRSSHFGLRFDFKTLFYSQNNPNGGDFMADVSLGLGPSLLF
ncbi:MAG: hypothetical protein R3A11_01680 [Bdellovibrionota bacterium]